MSLVMAELLPKILRAILEIWQQGKCLMVTGGKTL